MQAIILAAGMGKRLKDLTNDMTKCMVKVNGVTMIERMLVQLDKICLTRIVLVVGFRAAQLKDFIRTLEVKTPIEYVENTIYSKTNNIYSLFLAKEYLIQQDTLLLESDLVFDNIVLQSIIEDPYPSLALVARYESWMDGTVVTLQDGDHINDFLSKENFQYADIRNYYKTVNIYKFSRQFSENYYVPFLEAYCHALGNNEYYEQVLKVITKLGNAEIKAKILESGNWYEIDDVQDLDIAESIFANSDYDKLSRLQSRFGGYWRYPHMLDFCYLVNPYFPPQKLLDEVKANFDVLATSYPSGQRVNDLLSSKYFGVSPLTITTGNGAAELIKVLLSLLPGKTGIVYPAFEEYSNRKGTDVVAYSPENPCFAYSANDLIDFFEGRSIRSLVIVNPDNPSGNYIACDDLMRLVKWTAEKDITFIVDESFADFSETSSTLINDKILADHPSLVVIKSISKSYGVPGFRLGVLACGDMQLMNMIRKELSIWNINSFAEFYLQICEKYKRDFDSAMNRFYIARSDLQNELETIPYLRPIPSNANFIMCQVSDGFSARQISSILLSEHNILIKDLSGKKGIEGEYVRIAVKTKEENRLLCEALRSIKG